MELAEFFDYKNLLMKELCCDKDIVYLLTGNEDARVPNHGLPYTQIFPYQHVPDTVSEAKSFICFDVDIVDVPNRTYYLPAIYVWVFTHKDMMRADDGRIIIDQLAVEINQILNGSRLYGLGELALKNVRRFTPIDDYQGRVLTFTTTDFNRQSGSKQRPANRKIGV